MPAAELCLDLIGQATYPGPPSCLLLANVSETVPCVEVVVGTRNGNFLIFAPNLSGQQDFLDPVTSISELGQVSALTVGDILNAKKKHIGVINAEGAIHIYSVTVQEADLGNGLNLNSGLTKRYVTVLTHRQLLPANICVAHVCDIDRDGNEELIVALTDRIVRTYRFHHEEGPTGKAPKGKRISGRFVPLNKWEVPAQITALALVHSPTVTNAADLTTFDSNAAVHLYSNKFTTEIVLSQPENRYVKLIPQNRTGSTEGSGSHDEGGLASGAVDATVEYIVAGAKENGSTAFVPIYSEQIATFYPLFNNLTLIPLSSGPADTSEQFVVPSVGTFSTILIEKIDQDKSLIILADWSGRGLLITFEPKNLQNLNSQLRRSVNFGRNLAFLSSNLVENFIVFCASYVTGGVSVFRMTLAQVL